MTQRKVLGHVVSGRDAVRLVSRSFSTISEGKEVSHAGWDCMHPVTCIYRVMSWKALIVFNERRNHTYLCKEEMQEKMFHVHMYNM